MFQLTAEASAAPQIVTKELSELTRRTGEKNQGWKSGRGDEIDDGWSATSDTNGRNEHSREQKRAQRNPFGRKSVDRVAVERIPRIKTR